MNAAVLAFFVFGACMAALGIGLAIGEGVGRRKEREMQQAPAVQPRNARGQFAKRPW